MIGAIFLKEYSILIKFKYLIYRERYVDTTLIH